MTFSLCIPTHNRADLLEYTLAGLPDMDCEIVVSDNASTDRTADVMDAAASVDKRIRLTGLAEHKDTFANTLNAFARATTEIVVYLPDDDSILAEPLLEHVERMKAEPDLVAIFTDSIAWDDAEKKELHRYYPQGLEATEFGPEHNVQIADFLLQTFIPPEIGVFRKDAAIKARVPVAKAQPYHIWAYNFSRLGKIRFDPLAFLKEHRVLKPGLVREHWGNMDGAWAYIGDEQRLGLESMILSALLDSGQGYPPDGQKANIHLAIQSMLLARTSLEIQRAVQRGDYILAKELAVRQTLWGGVKYATDAGRDDHALSRLAAESALAAYDGVLGAPSLEDLTRTYRIQHDGVSIGVAA